MNYHCMPSAWHPPLQNGKGSGSALPDLASSEIPWQQYWHTPYTHRIAMPSNPLWKNRNPWQICVQGSRGVCTKHIWLVLEAILSLHHFRCPRNKTTDPKLGLTPCTMRSFTTLFLMCALAVAQQPAKELCSEQNTSTSTPSTTKAATFCPRA
jgi:hypothetical protein